MYIYIFNTNGNILDILFYNLLFSLSTIWMFPISVNLDLLKKNCQVVFSCEDVLMYLTSSFLMNISVVFALLQTIVQ